MKIIALIACAICICFGFLAVGHTPTVENEYPLSTVVVSVENDVVTVEDFNGNLWEFESAEDWAEGDICAMIMNDCGTEEIHDDEILMTRYCGWVD